jgi:uncharacterized beta-barrel protein YwiB (DUF1934 family)/uncharacterized Zn-finger protein
MRFCVQSEKAKQRERFEELFVLEKQVIENIEYFVLRHFYYMGEFDTKNAVKGMFLTYSKNLIIFTQNEIVHIKNGKKSVAKFSSSFTRYHYSSPSDTQIIFGEKDVVNELIKTLEKKNFNAFHTLDPISASYEKHFFFISLSKLDRFQEICKTMQYNPKVSNTDKRIAHILSTLPEPKKITLDLGEVFMRCKSQDNLNHIGIYEFICPHCNTETEIELPDNIFFSFGKAEEVFCPYCGAHLAKEKILKYEYNVNIEQKVNVVDDYEDGVVVYDYPYTQTISGNRRILTPITNGILENIFIIEGGKNAEGLNGSVILRYNHKNNKHYILYEEVMEGETKTTKNRIKVADGMMELTKSGVVNVHMLFEEHKKNVTHYYTPYGALDMGIDTKQVLIEESEDEMNISVFYGLEMNQEFVADCNISINVKSKGIKAFRL